MMAEMTRDEAVKTLKYIPMAHGLDPEEREAICTVLAEVERLKEEGEDTNTAFEFVNETIGKLEAEVERLKRTLDWIAYGCDVGPEHEAYYACVEKAEKALKEEK